MCSLCGRELGGAKRFGRVVIHAGRVFYEPNFFCRLLVGVFLEPGGFKDPGIEVLGPWTWPIFGKNSEIAGGCWVLTLPAAKKAFFENLYE